MKRGYTLVELLVSLGLVFVGILLLLPVAARLLWPPPRYSAAGGGAQNVPPPSITMFTREHDGHWWVSNTRGHAIVHHPDCPCRKLKAEVE
jgi:hypothetical protein